MAVNELVKQKEELAAKLAALDAQINAARAEERADVIKKIQAMMAEHDIRPSDLGGKGAGKRSANAGRKVPPKYRDPATGQTWSGRGIKPKWLSEKIAGGKRLEDFLI